jgi:hypothetical protein
MGAWSADLASFFFGVKIAFIVAAPLVITGLSRWRQTRSVTDLPLCPTSSAMVSMGTSLSLMIDTNVCRVSQALVIEAGFGHEMSARGVARPCHDVIPAERAGFLGADAGHDGQHGVGAQQRRRRTSGTRSFDTAFAAAVYCPA